MPSNKSPEDKIQNQSIHRRDFMKTGAALSAGALLSTGCATLSEHSARSNSRKKKPNIILFMTDDQSWRSIGYNSGGKIKTPCLDRAAAAGMTFHSAYCSSAPCIPSRSSLITGLHEHRYPRQTKGLLYGVEEGSWTWAHALSQAGYRTGLVGKMHFQPMRSRNGFEFTRYCENKLDFEWRAENDYYDDHQLWMAENGVFEPTKDQPAGAAKNIRHPIPNANDLFAWPLDPRFHPIDYCRDQAIQFLEDSEQDGRPWCLLVSFKFPHNPCLPAAPYDKMYHPDSFELPTGQWKDLKNMPPGLQAAVDQVDQSAWSFPRSKVSDEWLRKMLAAYHGLITQMDDAVREIMEHVDYTQYHLLFHH